MPADGCYPQPSEFRRFQNTGRTSSDQELRADCGPGGREGRIRKDKIEMKPSVAFAFVAFLCVPPLTSGAASAASPAYCALYAREYAAARVGDDTAEQAVGARQRVEDQAYYRCLNQDDAPEFPSTSAYYGSTEEDIANAMAEPFQDVAEGDAAGDIPDEPIDSVPVTNVPAPDAKPVVKPAKTASASVKVPASSGLTPFSAEWITWCKAHYKSFNATTGMVVTLSGQRRQCP